MTDNKAAAFDLSLKLLLLGDSAVGKTSLLMRFVDDKYSSTFISTVGVDFKSKIMQIESERVKLQVWDTAGQERFRTISLSFLRGAQGIALVFDLTDRRSFDHVRDWIKQVQAATDGSVPMVLCANKADLTDKYAVTRDEAEESAKSLGLPVFFTSAKSGDSVPAAFEHLARIATQKALTAKASRPAEGTVNLKSGASGEAAKEGCAC